MLLKCGADYAEGVQLRGGGGGGGGWDTLWHRP